MAPIDWTKPIQWASSMLPAWVDVKYIGLNGNKRVVCLNPATRVYQEFTDTGYPVMTLPPNRPYIRNTPPAPVWPQKRFFLCWEKAGVPRISGPTCERASCERQIACMKKSSLAALYSNFHIQEVNFGQ